MSNIKHSYINLFHINVFNANKIIKIFNVYSSHHAGRGYGGYWKYKQYGKEDLQEMHKNENEGNY